MIGGSSKSTRGPLDLSIGSAPASTPVGQGPQCKRVLLVDDNVIILRAYSNKLRLAGYDVQVAADGSAALSAIRQHAPDLLLLDLGFPPDVGFGGVSWDGFTILDWLRRLREDYLIPVIIISGEDPARYRERAEAAGVVTCLRKPVQPAELLDAVAKVLGEPGQKLEETKAK